MAHKITTLLFAVVAFQFDFTGGCRVDYTYIEACSSCYKYTQQLTLWSDARDKCISEGASLFYPENEAELLQVLTVLSVSHTDLLFGFSDLASLGDYRILDGRSVTQAYHTWYPGHPRTSTMYRCGRMDASTHALYIYDCSSPLPFICKYHKSTSQIEEIAASSEVKEIVANATEKLTAIEQQVSIQTTVLQQLVEAVLRQTDINQSIRQESVNQTDVLKQLMATVSRQATALNRQTELTQRQIAFMDRQAGSQTAVLERLVEAVSNQSSALARQAAAANQLAANQTALVLEKLAGLEDDQQINARNEQ